MSDTRTLTLKEAGVRKFDVVEAGAAYRLNAPGVGVSLELDRLSWSRHELGGELLVRCDFDGTDAIDGVLSVAQFNVSSARARTERASLLKNQSRAADIPWNALIEELCQRTLTAERSGDPAVALKDIEPSGPIDPALRVFGFELPRRHPSIVFGDGGTTKSLLALYMAGLLAREGYRVAIFDWELDGTDHRDRYGTLFGEDLPATVFYERCARPLTLEVDRIKRIVQRQGIDFGIFDSVGYACHVKPETAEAALAYFQANRQIGIGGVHIAHVNRSEDGTDKPFGSAFWHNSARATWYLKATEEPGGVTVGVFNRKHNLRKWGKQPPFAYRVDVDGDRTAFNLCEITAVDALSGQVPLTQRIKAFLKAGARTRQELATEFSEAKAETLRRIVDREIKHGRLTEFQSASGEKHIGLVARVS